MKMQNAPAKRRAARAASRRAAGADAINLPRLFLFLEVFVDKETPGRPAK